MASVKLPEGDVITTEAEGIHVEKDAFWFNESVVQIEFTITSDEEEPKRITIRDEIPDEEGPDEVEFHPKYDPYNWSRNPDGDVEYENEVAPGERVVTAYGFTTPGLSDLSWVRRSPEVWCEHADDRSMPNLDETTRSNDAGARTAQGDGEPGTSSEEQPDGAKPTWVPCDGEIDATPPNVGEFPVGEFTRSSSGRVEGDEGEDQRETAEPTEEDIDESADGTDESLVRALIDEIHRGDLETEEIEALRTALIDPRRPGEGRFRFEDLKANVKNLELFLESLDDFLDGGGVLEDIRDELKGANRERRELRSDVATLRERLDGVEEQGERLDELEASLTDLERIDGRMDGLKAEIDDRIASVEGELAQLQRSLERVDEWREQMLTAISYDPHEQSGEDTEGKLFD